MKNEFKQILIEQEINKLGIKCVLETEFEAKQSAYPHGNDYQGWNHRIW